MSELGKRAVACKHWRWMGGARAVVPKNLPMAWGTTRACRVPHTTHPTMVPDLRDPATLGCLLALVRETYQCPWLSVVGSAEDGWRIDAEGSSADVSDLHSFGSEAEAMIAALEEAE